MKELSCPNCFGKFITIDKFKNDRQKCILCDYTAAYSTFLPKEWKYSDDRGGRDEHTSGTQGALDR